MFAAPSPRMVPQADVDAMLAKIPQAATKAPLAERTGAAVGAEPGRYAREDHQHPRLTSVTIATIAAGSTAAVAFTRSFAAKPGVTCIEVEGASGSSAQPALFKVESWAVDAAGAYVGCTIRVWRAQLIPQNLATLLATALFNLFGASAAGTTFTCIAVARSDGSSS